MPSEEQVESELNRIQYRKRFLSMLVNTVAVLIVVAAAAVLVSTVFMPVIQVSGSSMSPTLNDGDILITFNTDNVTYGDLCCVSWQNKMLLKRVIGLPGDTVSIAEDGSVSVNGRTLDEPYVIEKSLGDCEIAFPYGCPKIKSLFSGITAGCPWTAGTGISAVSERNRSSARCCSGSGRSGKSQDPDSRLSKMKGGVIAHEAML